MDRIIVFVFFVDNCMYDGSEDGFVEGQAVMEGRSFRMYLYRYQGPIRRSMLVYMKVPGIHSSHVSRRSLLRVEFLFVEYPLGILRH